MLGDLTGQDLLDAINWVIDNHQSGKPAVATFGLLIDGAVPELDAAVRAMIDDGITVVIPGSEVPGTSSRLLSPARLQEAITVAASSTIDRARIENSASLCDDLFAPGEDIPSADYSANDRSTVMSGTPMAAAHVAGAAALILEQHPMYTPAQVWAMLDAESTTGAIQGLCCSTPNKLLYITDVPWAPSGLQAAVAPTPGIFSGSARLTWNTPGDPGATAITGYVIEWSTDGETWTRADTSVATATSYMVTGLTNGTRYVFRVAAKNDLGVGARSGQVEATPVWKPATPTGLTATLAPAEGTGSGQVKLTWTAPADNGAAITDYSIQHSTDGVVWINVVDGVSTATKYTVSGLTNGTTYRFRVLAKNAIGSGAFTESIQAAPRWMPSAPTGLTAAVAPATGVKPNQVKLTWTGPSDNGGAAITDYVIESSVDGTTWATVEDGVSTATTFTVSGLTNGTEYSFRVAARNDAGPGPYTATIQATPKGSSAPTGLAAVVAPEAGVGSTQVRLSWNAPASDGGATIQDYVIERSTPGNPWVRVNDGTSTATTVTASGLLNGILHRFRVAAVNSYGVGPWSDTIEATPRGLPGAPASLTARAVPADGLGSGEVKLAWAAPSWDGGAAVNDYLVEKSTDGTTWAAVTDGLSTATTYTVGGLTNGTHYSFRVSAGNVVGFGNASANVLATPVWTPAAPGELAAEVAPMDGLGAGEVKLTWAAPADNGAEISDYLIDWSVDGDTWTRVEDGVSTATTYTVGGLTGFTVHRFRVAAVNAVGEGPWIGIEATPVGRPPAPTGVTAAVAPTDGIGSGEVQLTWTAPSDGTIISYQVNVSSDAGSSLYTTNSSETTFIVPGLTNGTSYTFEVAAVSAVGQGPSSAPITATPVWRPGAPDAVGAAVAPSAGVGSGQVSVTWSSPADGGLVITDYVIQQSTDATNWTTVNDGVSTSRTHIIARLTNGTRYLFRVAAVNGLGVGPWSAPVVATPRWKPTAPQSLRAAVAPRVGSRQVKLTWRAPAATGGAAVTDYVIQRSINGTTWTTINDGVSTARAHLVRRLTNGTPYRFRVAARNAAGQSRWSVTVRARPRPR